MFSYKKIEKLLGRNMIDWHEMNIQQNMIDIQHLHHYTMGSRQLADEVLQLFKTQANLYKENLQKLEDADSVMRTAHALKGSARCIGAWDIAEISANIEAQARECRINQGNISILSECIEDISNFIDVFSENSKHYTTTNVALQHKIQNEDDDSEFVDYKKG